MTDARQRAALQEDLPSPEQLATLILTRVNIYTETASLLAPTASRVFFHGSPAHTIALTSGAYSGLDNSHTRAHQWYPLTS